MGRLIVRLGRRELSVHFNDVNDFTRLLDEMEIVVMYDPLTEADVPRAILALKDVPLSLKITPVPIREPKVDDDRVYEVLRSLVLRKLERGETTFMLRELYVPLFGRELRPHRDDRDRRLVDKLIKRVRRALRILERELNVRFEEFTIYEYMGIRGRFKAFKITSLKKLRADCSQNI